MYNKMSSNLRNTDPQWLLLILTLPGRQPALRMRVWRGLQSLGAGVLRDGVYVLPARAGLEQSLRALAGEILAGRGEAQLLTVQADAGFQALFDRSKAYTGLLGKIGAAARGLRRTGAPKAMTAMTTVTRLRRELECIAATDYFPTTQLQQARRTLDALHAQATARSATDEPRARKGRIPRLARADYQGRIWQSRARPWVDRLASAWLIQRFIDPHARFRWIKQPSANTGTALGFDYDGAAFTHVGDKVTFEVLMESFGLQRDPAIRSVAQLVHYLDVGGQPSAEALGVETMLRGMRERIRDDQQLFAAAAQLFDDLYSALVDRK
jgi:hypothetical protein